MGARACGRSWLSRARSLIIFPRHYRWENGARFPLRRPRAARRETRPLSASRIMHAERSVSHCGPTR